MVAWTDYKTAARERGSLALEMYVVISTPQKSPDEVKAVLPDHLAYQQQQEQAGRLAFAGPLSDETGTQMEGMGLIVYRAEDFDEARKLAEDDPMHQTGARTFTIRRWLINEGSLQFELKLSGQSVSLA